jgi:hypothetical protein
MKRRCPAGRSDAFPDEADREAECVEKFRVFA